jgi:uncharacterized membrane protein YdbT with pleckstrin-like domain
MALTKCPECGGQLSTLAKTCPQCGFPMPVVAADVTTLLLEVRPSWWNFFWHLVFAWLIVPWIVAWLRRRSSRLCIYPDRIAWERGFLAKEARVLFIKDIRSVDVDQSVWGRLVNVGDVTISTAATVEAAYVVTGISQPLRVKDLIIAQRQHGGSRV